MGSMKSLFLSATIGSMLVLATHMGMSFAHAALITQVEITGSIVDLSFDRLDRVDTYDRDGLLVMEQFQPLPYVFPSVAVDPLTFSIFTSGLGGDPAPTAQTSGTALSIDLRSLLAVATGPWIENQRLIGGLAAGLSERNIDGLQLSWPPIFLGAGAPFLQSGAFSVHGRAQVERVPVPAAVILFGSGLFGIVAAVLRRSGNVKGQGDDAGLRLEGKRPFGSALILLVSPDAPFAKEIENQLVRSRYNAHVVSSVTDALPFTRQETPALALLDHRLPDWDILRTDTHLRHVPMMTLVPSDTSYREDDGILDLERGADGVHFCSEGYRLLLAKVGAYLRRAGVIPCQRGVYRVGALELDSDLHEVRIGTHGHHLSAKLFFILEALMKAPSKVISRNELIDLVWGPSFAIGGHTLDVHVHALRQLLQHNPGHLCRLITIKGVGFKLKPLSPAMPDAFDPNALPMAAHSLPRLRPSEVHNSNTQQMTAPSQFISQHTWLGQVTRQRRARLLRRKKSVRHLRNTVSVE
jgi:DNA-binding response OmpR family regulator